MYISIAYTYLHPPLHIVNKQSHFLEIDELLITIIIIIKLLF